MKPRCSDCTALRTLELGTQNKAVAAFRFIAGSILRSFSLFLHRIQRFATLTHLGTQNTSKRSIASLRTGACISPEEQKGLGFRAKRAGVENAR